MRTVLRTFVGGLFLAALAGPVGAVPGTSALRAASVPVIVPGMLPRTPNAGRVGGAPPSTIDASHGTCEDATVRFSGIGLTSNLNSHGIYAGIDPDSGFQRCASGDGHGASYAWVGIQDNTYGQEAIMQIGIADCNDNSGLSFCVGYAAGTHHYFGWVGNACGHGDLDWDGGVANSNAHYYRISFNANGYWYATIDGATKFSILNSDSRISCWINRSTRQTAWAGETHDYGDGLGSSVSPMTHFDSMMRYDGTSWTHINQSTCSAGSPSGPHMFCTISGDSMNAWTVY